MASRKNSNYKYLLSLYARVDDFLSKDAQEELPDVIVSFCIVNEKTLKLKLYNKNPLLIFDQSTFKVDDALSAIALKKERDIETAKVQTILNRFGIVFKNVFTPDEIQALIDIYAVRNYFVHSYIPDDKIIFDPEDMVKKMGTVWEKISKIAIALFGKENIKNGRPKKKYTEKELEQVLETEVRKMIEPLQKKREIYALDEYIDVGASVKTLWRHDECPRCGAPYFSTDDQKDEWTAIATDFARPIYTKYPWVQKSVLYKCKKCNLELTEKQYEIAKNIIDNRFHSS